MKHYTVFHRVTSVLCTLALLLGMCAVPVAAADTLSVTAVTGTSVTQGSTGECSVYIDSTESLASLSVTVHFDPAKVKITDLYNSVDCVLYDSAENADNIQFSYILDGEGEAARTRLFYFRYEVLSDAETGAAFFDITVSEAYDSSLNTVPVTGSRCYFNIAEKQVNKRCTVRVDKTAVSAVVEEEFSLSYSFSTNQIASGFATVSYDPELFEVVGVTNGALLSNKVADVNIAMAGSVYLSFVGTEYADQRDVMTVTFKPIKNVTDTSSISFKVSELYDLDRNAITCPSVSSTVQLAFDPNYTGDAPTMKLNAEYDSTTEQVTAVITLEELSKLGAGDFVVEFDPEVLTLAGFQKGFNPNFFTTNDREAQKGIFKFSIVSLKDIVAAQTVMTLTFDVTYACTDQNTKIALSGSMLTDSLTNPIVLNIRGDETTVPLRHYIGDWVIDPAPTCTETGLNVRKCTVCSIVLETGDVIPKNGHKPVADEAVAPTCTDTGLTEGSHCSVCNAVLVAQQVIPANGHTEGETVVENAFDPDCTNVGGYENVVYCTVCEEELSREPVVVDPLGHTEVIDEAVPYTCRENGLTEGKHCSVCNEVLIAQKVVPAAHEPDGNGLCGVCNKYVGTCGTNVNWELDQEGILTIYGTGAMSEFYTVSSYQPWYSRREEVKKVVIENGITVIGRNAFNGCSNLAEIEIPDSVRQINYRAFYNCTGLLRVDIPDSVETIETGVFYDCASLETVRLPANLKTIANSLFYNCRSLMDLEIPETVTDIESNAFYNCQSLTELEIPVGVTQIGGGAFQSCCGLTRMEIPAGVTTLGNYVFSDCTGLLHVALPAQLTKIGSYAFSYCTSLAEIEIPDTVTEIGAAVFYNCRSLTSVQLPEGITNVADELFYGCSGLTDVKLPVQLTQIGASAFADCNSLTKMEIPEGVTVLSNALFSGCTLLTDVKLPAQLTKIGSSVFYNCTSLAEIEIPDTVTEIGASVFYNCKSLISVQLPEGVTAIANSLFNGCSGLTEVNIPENTTRIGQYAFADCTALTEITIPAKVTTVVNAAFQNCSGLKTIRFEGHAPAIENRVFRYVNATAYYPYPDSSWTADVMQNYSGSIRWQAYCTGDHTPVIDEAVVQDCVNTGLTEGSHCEICGEVFVAQNIIPANGHTESEIQVENHADPDCTNVGGYDNVIYCTVCEEELSREHVVIDALGHTEVIDTAVPYTCRESGLTEGKHCSVCDAVLIAQQVMPAAHKPDESGICTVCGQYFGTCGYNAKWELDMDGTLTIYGSGNMYDYYSTAGIPWFDHLESVRKVVVEEGITYVGRNAFLRHIHLAEVSLPDSLTGIGYGVFEGCTGLVHLDIPDSVTSIGMSAFYGCSNLETVNLPENLETIIAHTFSGCTSLTEIKIPETVTSIGSNSFYNCDSLIEVRIPAGVTKIESNTFAYCDSLVKVELPEGITSIGSSAFQYCTSLTEIRIPDSVTSLDSYAFGGCAGLREVEIPGGIDSIGNYAFANCDGLSRVEIADGVAGIGVGAFSRCPNLDTVHIPDSVTTLGASAFEYCTGLAGIEIPDSVTAIGNNAFYSCNKLDNVTVPGSATSIGDSAFNNCSNLKNITLSEGVQTLGERVFAACSKLTKVVLPSTVTSLGYRVFVNCYNLKEVRFMGDAPSFDSGTFGLCTTTVYYPSPNETWTEEAMQSYGGSILWKFYCAEAHTPVTDEAVAPDCTNSGLTEGSHCTVCDEILVPQEVVPANGHTDSEIIVENYKDADCTNAGGYDDVVYCTVCEVELSREHTVFAALGHTEGEIIVENYKDADCTNAGGYDDVVYCTVCEVELSREHTVFAALGHTEGEIIVENYKDPDCTKAGGYDNVIYCTVCDAELSRQHAILPALGHTEVIDAAVPNSCRESGLTEGKHCSVCNEVLIAQQVIPDAHDLDENGLCRVCGRYAGTWGYAVKWDLDSEGVLTVYGTGAMNGTWTLEEIPWYPYLESVKKAVVCEGVTNIGLSAFRNCVNLREVSLPSSLKTIDWQSFQGCTSLKEIVIPENVYAIYGSAFNGCTGLTKVDILGNVSNIESNVFSNCSSLTEIKLPAGLTAISSAAFQNCTNLTEIHIPDGVTSIGSAAFWDCSSLTSIKIPSGVTAIESYTFYGCSGLTAIEIPAGVTTVGASAFKNCNSLSHVFYRGTEEQKNEMSVITALTNATWLCETARTDLDDAEVYWCEECSRYYHPDGTLAPLKQVEITKLPDKLRYYTSDSLSVDGIEMLGSYSNGVQVSLGADDVESVSADLSVPGRKNAVITVAGMPVTFEIIVHDDGKVLVDPALYPESRHEYSNDMDESQTFTYPGAQALEITFNSLTAVENRHDCIYIYDGQDNLIAQYTDAAAANQTVIIPGDTFTVRLTSDYSVTKYGYAFSKIVADFGTGIQHDVIIDAATVTCTEAGLTEGSHCGICGDVLVAQEWIAALGHDMTAWDILEEATCTTTGMQRRECNRCGHEETEVIPEKGHTEGETVVENKVEPDCTNNGSYDNVVYCTVCGEELSRETVVVDAKGHTEVIDEAVEANCVNSGLTEGKHCSVCDEVLVKQNIVPAKGHTEVVDEAVEADCVNSGLTEGKHCSVCDEVLVKQNIVPAKGHTEGEIVVENKVEPDCTNDGSYDNVVYCTVCGEELSRETIVVDAKGHTEVIDEAVEPDCVNTGLTEGKHCSVCDEILLKQNIVPAKGHTEGETVVENKVEPDCTNNGSYDNVVYCTVCGEELNRETIVVDAKGHTEVVDEAVEADCVNSGLTEGKHCSVCDEILLKQNIVPAKGHMEVIDEAVEADCVNSGLTEGKHCSVCDEILLKQNIVPAKGHTEVVDEAVEPDCVNSGLTEGKHCSVCNEVLVEQTVIPAKGHSLVEVPAAEPTFEAAGNIAHFRCEGCGKLFADAEGETELNPEDVVLEKLSGGAVINGKVYETVAEALADAKAGDTVQMLQSHAETEVSIRDGIILDLNGYVLTADYVFAVKGSHIVDSSVGNTGLLAVKRDCIAVSSNNSDLPVWTGEGYLFVDILSFQQMYTANALGQKQFIFLPIFEAVAHRYLAQGKANSGVRIAIRMTWKTGSGSASQNFVFNDRTVKTVVESYNGSWYAQAFYVTVTNSENIDFDIQVTVISDTGVELVCN